MTEQVETIWDESGIAIGETRRLVESSDIEITADAPTHDPVTYVVEEHRDSLSRSYFVCEYLRLRENTRCMFL